MNKLTHIGKSTGWQAHCSRCHQDAAHDKKVRMGLSHALSNLLDKRQHNQSCNSMADEGCHNTDQCGEHHQDTIEAQVLDAAGDTLSNCMQQARGIDSLAKRKTSSCKDNDGPQKIVEVLFGQDAGAEEEDDWNDSHNSHVSEDRFELMADAPEHDGSERDNTNEPLNAGEPVLHGPDWHNGSIAARLECDKKQDPNHQD